MLVRYRRQSVMGKTKRLLFEGQGHGGWGGGGETIS